MSRWRQSREILREPAYRTKLAFFLILGFAIVLLAILLQPYSPCGSEILQEFAVVFIAVGLLQLLWDFLGGDPVKLRIEEVKDEVRNIEQSMSLLSDSIDGNIGVERIWPDRRSWQRDPADGLRVWHDRLCQAKRVDILSNTLWSNYMRQEEFRKRLFENIAQGAHVRILIYDPKSKVLRLRAKDEGDVSGEMQEEIKATLLRVAEERSKLPISARKNLEVRLTTQTLHLAQIIRADERMLVAIYLSGKSGGPSPTMQIRGSKSSYFIKYEEQFNILWERAKPLDDEQFNKILKNHGTTPIPPAEG